MFMPGRRKTARRQLQVSQGGVAGVRPEVLVRFRDIVHTGNVTGPYRGYLFYWKTTRIDAIDRIAVDLWPFLSGEKRDQFVAMTRAAGRGLPAFPPTRRDADTECAWAAGLFDAEGSVLVCGAASRRFVQLELPQSSAAGVPEVLERFRSAVGGGSIHGPHPPRSPWSRLPRYRWTLGARAEATRVLDLVWPWLSTRKRAQAEDAKRRVMSQGRAT